MPLVNADPIVKIAITCLASKKLTHDKPINLLLLSLAGNGKTSILMEAVRYVGNAMLIDGTTGKDLENLIAQRKHKLPSLVISDLLGVNNHKSTTSRNTWRVMQALMWDGVSYMGDAGGRVISKKPIMTNILTAMPTALFFSTMSYAARKTEDKMMGAQGILRRMLVINYDYVESSVANIHYSIKKSKQPPKKKRLPQLKLLKGNPEITPEQAAEIMKWAENVPKEIESHGFSYHKIYRAYAKTRALIRHSRRVSKDDMLDLREMIQFVDRFKDGYKI